MRYQGLGSFGQTKNSKNRSAMSIVRPPGNAHHEER